MPLTKLQFNPGINRETTFATNEGGWYDCDKVRFRFGLPEKIGGWTIPYLQTFLGTCRGLHAWVALDREEFLGVGTSQKYYVLQGGAYNDITPVRSTSTEGDITVAATSGSAVLTVTHTAHGAKAGDFVTFSGGFKLYSGTNGNISDSILNQEYKIDEVIDDDTYTVRAREVDILQDITIDGQYTPTTVNANVNDDKDGSNNFGGSFTNADTTVIFTAPEGYVLTEGMVIKNCTAVADGTSIVSIDSVSGSAYTVTLSAAATSTGVATADIFGLVATYQINIGLDDAATGTGWGVGPWGRSAWSFPASVSLTTDQLRIWAHDNYGEDLIFNVRDGGIYYWDRSASTTNNFQRAVPLADIAGASQAPVVAKQVMLSDRDGHVIAFGCNPQGSSTQDPLLIRFSDAEDAGYWDITDDLKDAGDLTISSGSEIVSAIETRQEILVFTDASLHSMQYIGQPFIFGINSISENITIAGPLAAVAVEDAVFWMGKNEFYLYGGSVQRIPCTVRDYVYSDINKNQFEKVVGGVNSAFGEVWWFYPSSDSTSNNRYVVYNYVQKIWYYGSLERSYWLDRGILPNPIGAGLNGILFFHESGNDDAVDEETLNPMTAYIESSPIDIGEGDSYMFVSRMLPDVSFRESSNENPTLDLTIKMQDYPGEDFGQTKQSAVTRSATVPIEQYTDQINLRLRGRSMVLRAESSDQLKTKWRLGSPRVDLRPDGRK